MLEFGICESQTSYLAVNTVHKEVEERAWAGNSGVKPFLKASLPLPLLL